MSKYQQFTALAQGRTNYEIEVIAITPSIGDTPLMTVCATEEAIYITKEQAMKFFGLVDPSTVTVAVG